MTPGAPRVFTGPAILTLLGLFAMRFSIGLQFQWVAAAVVELRAAFGLSYADIGTLIGAFTLPGIVVTVVGGFVAQRFGDRRVLLTAFGMMTIGGVIGCLAEGFLFLVVSRVVSGVGAVSALTLLIKVTSDRFEGPAMRTALALVMMSWPGGIAAATVVWSAVSAAYGWRGAAIGATVVIALAGGLGCFVLARPAGDMPRGAVLRPTAREWRLTFKSAVSWAGFNGGLAVYVGFLPSVLAGLGLVTDEAAFLSGVAGLAMAIAMPLGGRVADLSGRSGLVIVTMTLLGAALVFAVAGGVTFWMVVILAGIAIGLPTGSMGGLLAGPIAPERKTLAYGFFGSGSNIGIALGAPAAGLARDISGNAGAPMVVAGALLVLTVVGYLWFAAERDRGT